MQRQKILVIGAGPIVIGQACEFDYSGTQACRILKSYGHKVILINPNPATIMTDPETADSVYIEPINVEIIEKVIRLEKPDTLLPTVGGQTALNISMDLARLGILDQYNVELVGSSTAVIENAEKRSIFNQMMHELGLHVPKNVVVNHVKKIDEAFDFIGVPAIIRPSFTLGGLGGGVATTKFEFFKIINEGLKFSPVSEVQVDESVLGWQEFELEVIRDSLGNSVVICAIENTDPMGVHTGDSVTVSPIMTLRDEEAQQMRDASFRILEKIGVNAGGANVQFAFNPDNGEIRVIEMNPRVSRSSALASKATGYPIAKVSAQLAIGMSLKDVKHDGVEKIPAAFEPAMDYVVVKIPRFNFDKFSTANCKLSSSMKSVGTAMAIGRCFEEALQKAFSSLEQGFSGLNRIIDERASREYIAERLSALLPNKILIIADALRAGFSIGEIADLSKYNEWFLNRIAELVEMENQIVNATSITPEIMLQWKKKGFADARIAFLRGEKELSIRSKRKELNVLPVFKSVDTCAGEFETQIAYLYSTYEGDTLTVPECESRVSDATKVVVLGSGPNRIGQGIEFDYTCVHAIQPIKRKGYQAIMVNCNPETVSTDYDISDKLYFAPVTIESVLDILDTESKNGKLLGVILQCGGQTPLKLARAVEGAGFKILGTDYASTHIAEDRNSFNHLIHSLGMLQPKNEIIFSVEEVESAVKKIGFPMIVRPSYVLGGESMQIIYDEEMLQSYLGRYSNIFNGSSLLLDRFVSNAIELDVDAISDGKSTYICGIMEHVEEAGVHSGDSAFVLPTQNISKDILAKIEDHTRRISKALKIIGFLNIQFAVDGNELYVLEVNPRASRTIPFIAKALGIPIARIAVGCMLGEKIPSILKNYREYLEHVFVKYPVFSFEKFPDADVLLGPEMKSTGEVMGVGDDFDSAFAKVCISSMRKLPLSGNVFFSIRDQDKEKSVEIAKILSDLGFSILATKGSAAFLKGHDIEAITVRKVKEGSPHIVDMIMNGEVQLVINTSSHVLESIKDSMSIRSSSVINQVPCCTNINSARALTMGIKKIIEGELAVYNICEVLHQLD